MTRYEKAKELLRAVQAEVEAALDEQIEQCAHPIHMVVEADHYSGLLYVDGPFRVCRACGLAEEGWGCGYWKLDFGYREAIPRMDRDSARRYVTRFFTQEAMNTLRYGNRVKA